MLESLPAGVFRWSGRALEDSIQQCLSNAGPSQVWLAAANLCAREGRGDWLDHLGTQLDRGRNHNRPKHFWGWLVFNTVTYLRLRRDETTEVARKLRSVARTADPSTREGLDQKLQAVSKIDQVTMER